MSAGQIPDHLIQLSDGLPRNSKSVICKICQSKMLLPGKGELVEKPTDLPFMTLKAKPEEGKPVESECVKDFWLVKGMFTFENIGFSHAVNGIKYLTCADCEQGPVGWCLDEDRNLLYLSHDRVDYA